MKTVQVHLIIWTNLANRNVHHLHSTLLRPGLTKKIAENLVDAPDDDAFLDSLEPFSISSSAPVDPNKEVEIRGC